MNVRALLYLALCLFTLNSAAHGETGSATAHGQNSPYRILHIMSYNSPWLWTDGQLAGFKEAMEGVPAVYRVFQMDTKRSSSPEAKEKKAREAMALIKEWKPDLVYTSDDDAQEYVTKHYINKSIPFVFSAVNEDPAKYGFVGSRNITGVMEREHFVESVNLLKEIEPGVKRIAVVFDDASMWKPVMARMKSNLRKLPGVEVVSWDVIHTFDEFRQKMKAYPGKVDAIGLIGIFNFKDEHGKNVPYQDVLKWTAENSTLPDFSFWVDRVNYGTLCAVTVSEREQGLEAGQKARAILTEGKSPSSFPMKPTAKGIPVISLARARKLGIKVKSGLLLSAEVITKFDWDK